MRIGIDYLPAVTHFPGVGRYARELVRALVRLEDAPALALLEAGGQARTIGEPHLGLAGARADVRRYRRRLPRRWMTALARISGRGADRWIGGVDLFHRIHTDWPPAGAVVQVQPVGELPPRGSAECRATGRRLAEFDHWLVMSAHGERELEERYGFDAARIHSVPIGSDQWRRELPAAPPRADPPIVLVLGALQPRRRPNTVLAAFRAARDLAPDVAGRAQLVFAGGAGVEGAELSRAMTSAGLGDDARWRPDLTEADLPALVGGASALVHLTEGEESAVTPLEAFSFGTPVVASGLGAFVEALGDEAQWVDNAQADADPAELGRAIARAIESATDADAIGRREAIAARYTWEVNARETLRVWASIVAGA